MSATNDFDRQRIRLEDIIGCNLASRRLQLKVLNDIYRNMKTKRELINVKRLNRAIRVLEEQHRYLVDFHPDKLEVER